MATANIPVSKINRFVTNDDGLVTWTYVHNGYSASGYPLRDQIVHVARFHQDVWRIEREYRDMTTSKHLIHDSRLPTDLYYSEAELAIAMRKIMSIRRWCRAAAPTDWAEIERVVKASLGE